VPQQIANVPDVGAALEQLGGVARPTQIVSPGLGSGNPVGERHTALSGDRAEYWETLYPVIEVVAQVVQPGHALLEPNRHSERCSDGPAGDRRRAR
jgi:hypothetical protein